MKTRNIFLALLVMLMSTAMCPAQEGEATKEGVPVVEEIVTDSNATDDAAIGGAGTQTTTRVGSWSVTYTNDSVDAEVVEKFLEETFDEEFGNLLGGIIGGGAALGGLLITGLVLLCVFGLPLLVIILIIWLIIRLVRKSPTAAPTGQATAASIDEQGRDRTLFNKGVRNVCLGVGLAIFLGMWMGSFGVGVGALIACIGIGELLVDYFAKK